MLPNMDAALDNPALRPILITDDDSDDVFLLQHRLRKAGVPNPILTFRDGEELLNYFAQADLKARPLLLLLDLKMPMVDGFDTLAALRVERNLRNLPVAVITSSIRALDRDRTMDAGATEFFEKFPSDTDLADVVARASKHPFSLEA